MDEHDLRCDGEIRPGRYGAVEVGGSSLGNGDEADQITVLAEIVRAGHLEASPGGMVDDARECGLSFGWRRGGEGA